VLVSGQPTCAQVRELPVALRMQVPERYADTNGHMNVRRYVGLHDQASWNYLGGLGLGEQYVAAENRSFFDLEHHLRYLEEVLVGDEVTVHFRLVARSTKLLHGMGFLVNATREQVANTFEFLAAHIDLGVRRTAPFDEAAARSLDDEIGRHEALDWEPPTCGALGIRRTPAA
jgi:acyl-CoA thioester hydrolase